MVVTISLTGFVTWGGFVANQLFLPWWLSYKDGMKPVGFPWLDSVGDRFAIQISQAVLKLFFNTKPIQTSILKSEKYQSISPWGIERELPPENSALWDLCVHPGSKGPTFAKWVDNWPSCLKLTGNLVHFSCKYPVGKIYKTWEATIEAIRLDRHPRASGDRPPGSNPLWRGWVYRLAPEAPLFRGMPTRPEAFLEPPGASGLRSCAQTHIKKALCHTCPIDGTVNKYRAISAILQNCYVQVNNDDNGDEGGEDFVSFRRETWHQC